MRKETFVKDISDVGRLSPVPFTRIRLGDRFWQPRQEKNRKVTLPIEYENCKKTGRLDVWTWKPGQPCQPHIFWDSDVAKWIEAVGYSLATNPDPELERKVDEYVDAMAACQGKDGYLNSHYLLVEPDKRWTNLRDCHELYCAGHLMEGAVAYAKATGKKKILDVLCRYADHIAATFGRGEGQKRGYCGHPEIELALVRLYLATGQKRYLDLAWYFVDERGRQPNYYDIEAKQRGEEPDKHWFGGLEYQQAHKPVVEQTSADGHAVRAIYLYCGMADVAAHTGDAKLAAACRNLWKSVTRRRMYITGGVGSARNGERFTIDYDLPNETAYAETCAAIAMVFFAHRMLHMEPDGRYADVMERALYNGVLSGVGLDGKTFFYANPLLAHPVSYAARPGEDKSEHTIPARQEWFGCSCCPPNVARLLASFGEYIYSTSPDSLYVHLYAGSRGETEVAGCKVGIDLQTDYPWDGTVKISINPERPVKFALALRIPGWCRGAKIKVNAKIVPVKPVKGYALIRRQWAAGDRVELLMPMPVERIEARPEVRDDCGKVALQRGPVVYCIEECDNGKDLADISLPRNAKLTQKFEPGLLGGAVTISAKAIRRDLKSWKDDLYRPAGGKTRPVKLKAVPYCLWNNRTPGEMAVWIRQV